MQWSDLESRTQILDSWDHCKDSVPKQVSTKDPKTTLLNADLWNWIYPWQLRYRRHNLWHQDHQVMRHLNGEETSVTQQD